MLLRSSWATREQPEEWKNAYEERDGYYVLDITEYVKSMFLERVKMSPGFSDFPQEDRTGWCYLPGTITLLVVDRDGI